MNRRVLAALAGVLALCACSSGGASLPRNATLSASDARSAPYTIPVSTSATAQDAERRAKAKRRTPKDSYGGVPTFSGSADFMDAPLDDARQVNLAIVGVDAMSGGVAYPLVEYDTAVIVNALDFQRSALNLGSNDLPALAYDGLRLKIDPAHSSVVKGSTTYPMVFGTVDAATRAFTPGAGGIQSINFAMPFDGSSGSAELYMDFSAVDSIAIRDGVAQVAPRLHGAPRRQSGVITGTIVNHAGSAVVNATIQAVRDDGTVAATTVSAADGTFELHGIRAGTFQITVYNVYVTAAGQTISAQNADFLRPLNAMAGTVPNGYRLDLGLISD
ncbi:MAG: carboxypeptidase regulatory-like domain-containing protein [Candidatus Velthaea sp.]